MKTIWKIGLSAAIIFIVPILLFVAFNTTGTGRLLVCAITLIIVLLSFWVRKKIIKGPIRLIEIQEINENGELLDKISIVEFQQDRDLITSIFNKKAEFFLEDEFEYSQYAICIYTNKKKPVVLYPDKNNKEKIKINKYIWGIELDEKEAMNFNCIIERYWMGNMR